MRAEEVGAGLEVKAVASIERVMLMLVSSYKLQSQLARTNSYTFKMAQFFILLHLGLPGPSLCTARDR